MTKEEQAKRTVKRELERHGISGDFIDDQTGQPDTEQIVEAVQKRRKPGGKSASLELNTTATNEEISQILRNALYWYHRDVVKSDEECAERLNEFFEHVAQTGEIPTVEKMCISLGTTREVVWRWERGDLGEQRSHMIKKAKEILSSMDAELVQKNKIPQVTYIFRAKNYYGMRDQTDVVVTPNNPLGDSASQKELAEKYEDIYDE